MPKARRSAGILLYRRRTAALEVFLVHPGGPFWTKRDEGAWSIPKGEFPDDEDPLEAALREFEEETGTSLAGRPRADFTALPPVRQAAGKTVYAWAAAGDLDADAVRSNPFTMEWPPRSGLQREFPEVDRAAWYGMEAARVQLLVAQRPLLDALEALLRDAPGG
ncbi:MAG TPA: NUDIX domain-containing protein [Usitatibacter sp.]|jgi:predicted NUDIX family NTP pyrophosphohydrolase|nr:NUDIX domain-containing protein [Usitatibacter sp.]